MNPRKNYETIYFSGLDYHRIYKHYYRWNESDEKKEYFRKWNWWCIDGKDIDESMIFTAQDLYYINKVNKQWKNWMWQYLENIQPKSHLQQLGWKNLDQKAITQIKCQTEGLVWKK